MKIVSIFAGELYAFHYDGEADDAFSTLIDQWEDADYLSDFYKAHQADIPHGMGKYRFVDDIQDASFDITEQIEEIVNDKTRNLDEIFKPYHNQECGIVRLSIRKSVKSFLRVYAVRIDKGVYVVTSGCIKLTRAVQDRVHTVEAVRYLNRAKDYLKDNNIFDEDAFYEWYLEQ